MMIKMCYLSVPNVLNVSPIAILVIAQDFLGS